MVIAQGHTPRAITSQRRKEPKFERHDPHPIAQLAEAGIMLIADALEQGAEFITSSVGQAFLGMLGVPELAIGVEVVKDTKDLGIEFGKQMSEIMQGKRSQLSIRAPLQRWKNSDNYEQLKSTFASALIEKTAGKMAGRFATDNVLVNATVEKMFHKTAKEAYDEVVASFKVNPADVLDEEQRIVKQYFNRHFFVNQTQFMAPYSSHDEMGQVWQFLDEDDVDEFVEKQFDRLYSKHDRFLNETLLFSQVLTALNPFIGQRYHRRAIIGPKTRVL